MLDAAVFCRNEEDTIGGSLRGLRDQTAGLDPARLPLRAFVMENGSSDRTAAAARKAAVALEDPGRFEVLVRAELPAGKAGAWNAFLGEARAPLVAFVDADVRLSDGALGAMLDLLTATPALDLVGATPSVSPDFIPRGFWQDVFTVPYRSLRPAPSLSGNAYVARRSALTPLPLDTVNEDLLLAMRHADRFALCPASRVYVVPPAGVAAFVLQRARILRGDRIERRRSGQTVARHRRRASGDLLAFYRAAGATKLLAFLAAIAAAAACSRLPGPRTPGWDTRRT